MVARAMPFVLADPEPAKEAQGNGIGKNADDRADCGDTETKVLLNLFSWKR